MGTLHSPGTHQPADHCWFLMTERGTEQVNHEAVMGDEQSVVSQHTLLSKISPWPWAVSVVMGIPSVKREVHSYLTDTLNSLISELTQQEKEDSVIVVLIAEVRQSFASLSLFLGPHPIPLSAKLSAKPDSCPPGGQLCCLLGQISPALGCHPIKIIRCVLPKMKPRLGQRESGCKQANINSCQCSTCVCLSGLNCGGSCRVLEWLFPKCAGTAPWPQLGELSDLLLKQLHFSAYL